MTRMRPALACVLLLCSMARAEDLGFLFSQMYCKDAYLDLKHQWEQSPEEGRERIATEMQAMASSCQAQYERNLLTEQKRSEDAAARAKAAKLPGARLGMTTQTVRTKTQWGEPLSINRTTTASGVREQWVYGGGNYLYFVNGRLTAIQN